MARSRPFPAALVVLPLLALAAVPAADAAEDEFMNLEVLPKDIGKQELIGTMRGISTALGVRCDFCHVERTNEAGETVEDFASDDKEHKRTARGMMRMTREINARLLPAAGLEHPAEVGCITCHRGLTDPRTIDRVLLAVAEKDGVDAAIRTYRELRDEHYGDGSYDFSPAPLAEVAEQLAERRQDVDGALAVARFNVELHPEAVRAHVLLGQLLARRGDREAAIASLERALELEPDNRWVQRLLGQLRQPAE